MFETNIPNNSPHISLARASQLTGYHQDYLGQLCRLGKLEAVKIGRNWFTSPEALNSIGGEVSDNVPSPVDSIISQPIIVENIMIPEVEGLPISIRTVPTNPRNTNSVQGILTNMRIESLQKEVMELRQILFRLMEEVKSHTSILQTKETVNRVQDSLKHSYVSNFDFNIPEQRLEGLVEPPVIWEKPKRSSYVLINWVMAMTVVVAISFLGIGLVTSNFFGQEQPAYSVYYRTVPKHLENTPEVAGAVSSENSTLPTDGHGEFTPIMIR